MRARQILIDREKGALPISIGTSLAIESAQGVLPEKEVQVPPILSYDALYVNLRTLYRNILGSIPTEERTGMSPDLIAETISNEMQVIEGAIRQTTNGKVKVVFYLCTFASLNRKFPHALHKNATTENQKFVQALEGNTFKEFQQLQPDADLRVFDMDFEQDQRKVLIITHFPVDLLNRYKFSRLVLLETHTGAMKPHTLWYTKLYNGKELNMIPFDRMTVQLFGDGNLFTPAPIKLRRHILDLAKRYKWTSVTTKDMVLRHVSNEHDPVLEGYIRKLYST